MSPLIVTLVYCGLIVLASLSGGVLPSLVRLTHTRLQLTMSFVAGLMLGVALLHLLPHANVETGSLDVTVGWTMGGLLVMFFLMRAFHFHQHGAEALGDEAVAEGSPAHDQAHGQQCAHDHAHHHHEPHPSHHHGHAHHHDAPVAHRMSWAGVAFGLAIHTLIDGVALGAAVYADARHQSLWPLYGVGVFLAIALHKPLDALSITSLMAAGGWSSGARQLVNAGFALMCPAGALLVALGMHESLSEPNLFLGCALGFSAGVFLCISLSDLLPEVQFHTHDRVKLSALLLLGVAASAAIGFLEPEHSHSGPHPEHHAPHDYEDGAAHSEHKHSHE